MEKLSKEERGEAVQRIKEFFHDERGEVIGDLAAGIVLDFIESQIAPALYNRGVRDARALALRFSGSLTEELEFLEVATPVAARKGPTKRLVP